MNTSSNLSLVRYFQSSPTKSELHKGSWGVWLSPRIGLDDVTFYKARLVTYTKDTHLGFQLSPENIQAGILLYLTFYSPASFAEKLSI